MAKPTVLSKPLTLQETAARLGFESEKSVRRLIAAGKIKAEKLTLKGKKRWVIKDSEITRYKILEGGWLHSH